jgi:hypothetical protein
LGQKQINTTRIVEAGDASVFISQREGTSGCARMAHCVLLAQTQTVRIQQLGVPLFGLAVSCYRTFCLYTAGRILRDLITHLNFEYV